jgi:hypothetical protein
MRFIKLACALLGVLALTAITASTSFAVETLWQWLPGAEKTTFTAKSGEAKLEAINKAVIKCTSSSVSLVNGELTTEKTLALAIIDFTGCTALGFPINSLGDDTSSGVILAHVELHNCIIATSPALRDGILFKLLELHLDIPALGGLLITVRGSFIAEVAAEQLNKSKKEYKLTIKQTAGKQAVEKCEGGSKDTLESKTDSEEKFLEAGEEATGAEVNFDVAQEAMA